MRRRRLAQSRLHAASARQTRLSGASLREVSSVALSASAPPMRSAQSPARFAMAGVTWLRQSGSRRM
jgi:hypothetical protein